MGFIDFLKSLFGHSDSADSQQPLPEATPEPSRQEDAAVDVSEAPAATEDIPAPPAATEDITNQQNTETMKTSELMLKFLKEQGFLPEVLDNGNIFFKYQMKSFIYIENDEDPSFFQLALPSIFDVTEDNREAALVAANAVSSRMKVAKVIVTDDTVTILAECLLDSSPELEDIVPRFLNILMSSQQEFYNEIN